MDLSPSWWCSSFTDNGLVNWDSLLLHSESPGYWGRMFSKYWVCQGEVILMWFCELFMEGGDGIFPDSRWFSWPETGWWGWYLTLFATQFHFHTNSRFLSLPPSFSHTLPLALQFTPSNMQRCTPCLCAGCCCLIARSPSRSSDVVVVCLHWLECVTCLCPGSLEGVCFCSHCCKQGGAPFPNRSVGEGYFHRSYFFFLYHLGQ